MQRRRPAGEAGRLRLYSSQVMDDRDGAPPSPRPSVTPAVNGESSLVAIGLLAWWLLGFPWLLGSALGRLLREVRPDSGVCTSCSYDLRGAGGGGGRCPECGTFHSRTETPAGSQPRSGERM